MLNADGSGLSMVEAAGLTIVHRARRFFAARAAAAPGCCTFRTHDL